MTGTGVPEGGAREPARRPCYSCPYRRDVPSGIWHPSEYRRLPLYDEPTWAQPTGVFLCHKQNGRVCAGWAGTHDPHHLLALRLAGSVWSMSPGAIAATLDYVSPVPLFRSGQEACDHGMADVDDPGPEARAMIRRLVDEQWRINDKGA